MKRLLFGFILGALVSLPVSAFARSTHDWTAHVNEAGNTITRFDDPDFQVKCWLHENKYRGGISCLPWDQVKDRD